MTTDTIARTRSALQKRYGAAVGTAATSTEAIELMLRHRTVRQFVPGEIGDETRALIVAAAQSASTSANFQFTSIVSIRDPARRNRLALYAGDQQHVRDAGLFLVWVADWARSCEIAERHGHPTQGADYLDNTLSSAIDVALAAQNAAVAAESLGYGISFVGALRNRVDEVCAELRLPPRTFPLFGLAIGTPDPTDRADVKPRLPQSVVLHEETYRAFDQADIDAYSDRINHYYRVQERPDDWVNDRLAWRIAGEDGMDGRHAMRESLAKQGFPLR